MRIAITRRWDGAPAEPGEHVTLALSTSRGQLIVECDAPLHGDAPPTTAPGSTAGLWNHEVVELFLYGAHEPGAREPGAHEHRARYLELEFGPFGHYLALRFHGVRRRDGEARALDYRATREGDRWRGRARVDASLLPPGLARCNAHAIHGLGAARRYLSAVPAPGTATPDFHQPARSEALAPSLLAALAR